MFPSFHRCNLCRTKLPHDSETSCRCSVKSLCSTAQFSFVSESIRSASSCWAGCEVAGRSDHVPQVCVFVVHWSEFSLFVKCRQGTPTPGALLMCVAGPPQGERLAQTCPSDRHINPAWQSDAAPPSARKTKRRMTRKCSCQIKAFASLLLYYDMLFG